MKKRNIFLKWMQARRLTLVFFAIYSLLILLTYNLYRVQMYIPIYIIALAAFIGSAFAAVDFVVFYRKFKALESQKGYFPIDKLPENGDLCELQYKELIYSLENERLRLSNILEEKQKNSEEYYTLWVHQIKTPISVMDLLLQQENLPPEFKYKMERELFRTEQYTNMALQYQRLKSTNTDFIFEKHSAQKLVNKALKNTATLFISKKISLKTNVFQNKYITDEKWFCFVLEQVFSNAIKYSMPETGTVEIFECSNGLIVKDNGIGIEAEDLPRIFEMGYTGQIGHKNARSTGIGLYLCREVAKKLCFDITVSSRLGKGTEVKMVFNSQNLELD